MTGSPDTAPRRAREGYAAAVEGLHALVDTLEMSGVVVPAAFAALSERLLSAPPAHRRALGE